MYSHNVGMLVVFRRQRHSILGQTKNLRFTESTVQRDMLIHQHQLSDVMGPGKVHEQIQ
jgi:hypothetical protein